MKVWVVTELFCSYYDGETTITLVEAFDSFDKAREFMSNILNERYEGVKGDSKAEERVDIHKEKYRTTAFLEARFYYDDSSMSEWYNYHYSIYQKEIK